MVVCSANQLCKDLGRQQSVPFFHIIQKRTLKGLRRENVVKSPSFSPSCRLCFGNWYHFQHTLFNVLIQSTVYSLLPISVQVEFT